MRELSHCSQNTLECSVSVESFQPICMEKQKTRRLDEVDSLLQNVVLENHANPIFSCTYKKVRRGELATTSSALFSVSGWASPDSFCTRSFCLRHDRLLFHIPANVSINHHPCTGRYHKRIQTILQPSFVPSADHFVCPITHKMITLLCISLDLFSPIR